MYQISYGKEQQLKHHRNRGGDEERIHERKSATAPVRGILLLEPCSFAKQQRGVDPLYRSKIHFGRDEQRLIECRFCHLPSGWGRAL
jgi:hypothetical protein